MNLKYMVCCRTSHAASAEHVQVCLPPPPHTHTPKLAALTPALAAPLAVLLGEAAPPGPAAREALAQALPDNFEELAQWERSALMRGVAILLGPELKVCMHVLDSLCESVCDGGGSA